MLAMLIGGLTVAAETDVSDLNPLRQFRPFANLRFLLRQH